MEADGDSGGTSCYVQTVTHCAHTYTLMQYVTGLYPQVNGLNLSCAVAGSADNSVQSGAPTVEGCEVAAAACEPRGRRSVAK